MLQLLYWVLPTVSGAENPWMSEFPSKGLAVGAAMALASAITGAAAIGACDGSIKNGGQREVAVRCCHH